MDQTMPAAPGQRRQGIMMFRTKRVPLDRPEI